MRLHVGLFLPLAVRSLAAALGPQTEAAVVLTLCRKVVSSMNPGTWPCVLRVAELGHAAVEVTEGQREVKAPRVW